MNLKEKMLDVIFREYDIRGLYDKELNEKRLSYRFLLDKHVNRCKNVRWAMMQDIVQMNFLII